MATADLRAKLSLVRLIGATRRQARRMIAGATVQAPPGQPGWHITVPAGLSGEILGGALLGLAGTLVPARLAQRARPIAAFGRGE
jgi:hypothetical protein